MIRKTKKFIFGGAMLVGLSVTASLSQAQEPQLLGEHGDWAAYTYSNSKGKVCYVVSQPKESEPKNVRRDPVFSLVTHRPGQRIHNEVSTIIGYPFKKSSDAVATIGGDKFDMFTSGDGAWIESNKSERRLVAAMKRGSAMTVKGTSWRGTLTTDRYSLAGVTAALEQIDQTCK